MAYRVGYQCFLTKEAAHDYLLSQQLPTITQNGDLIRPVKQGEHWYLQGQKVDLSLPECDVREQIEMGGLMSVPFIILCVIIFGVKQIRVLLESLGEVGND